MRTGALLLAGVILAPGFAAAQRISIGVVAGSGMTNDYSGSGSRVSTPAPGMSVTFTGTSSAHRPIIGPKVEVALTNRFSFEANALRRPSEWRGYWVFDPPWNVNGTQISTYSERKTDVTWEVPLLAKYRLPAFGRASPFIEAGPSVQPWLYSQGDAHLGITAGAGFGFNLRGIGIEPTVRYTRWGSPTGSEQRAKRDQVELLVGFAAPASSGRPEVLGRKLRFGFIGGFGLNGDFEAKEGFSSASSKMAGLSVGAALTDRFGVELNTLYRPRMLSEYQRATVLTWEFPVLASYKLTTGRIAPFVEAGPAFRSSGNTNNSNPSRFGATAGLGVQTTWHGIRISPRIRYTRWAADPPSDYPPQQPFSLRNQVDALVGFSF